MGLTRTEAILEVYVDSFVQETGSEHQALLWVLQQQEFGEFCVSACMHAWRCVDDSCFSGVFFHVHCMVLVLPCVEVDYNVKSLVHGYLSPM